MRSVILRLALTAAFVGYSFAADASECEKTHTCPPPPVAHHPAPPKPKPTPRYHPHYYSPTPTPVQAPTPTPTPPAQTMADYAVTWRLFPAYAGENYVNDDYAAIIGRNLKKYGFVRNRFLATDNAGLMWYGYDVVAALDRNELVLGHTAYTAVWYGAVWAFNTKDDLDTFIASPTKYRPAYGGLCAYCLAVNHIVPPGTDGTFYVYNHQLFLFASPDYRTEAMKDMNGTITAANNVWNPLQASSMVSAQMSDFSNIVLNAYNSAPTP